MKWQNDIFVTVKILKNHNQLWFENTIITDVELIWEIWVFYVYISRSYLWSVALEPKNRREISKHSKGSTQIQTNRIRRLRQLLRAILFEEFPFFSALEFWQMQQMQTMFESSWSHTGSFRWQKPFGCCNKMIYLFFL